jgi:RNA 2',3'-cyclic 3'-phosphodiesterase
MRLFVAVDVPPGVRARLAEAIEPVRGRVPGARWGGPESWHVTLKFLGSVEARLRGWVEQRLMEAAGAATPFPTRLTALGAFPSGARARVLWAGLDDAQGELVRLAAAVDGALEAELPRERRPFTAHLTLARFREEARIPPEALATAIESEPFRVEELALYRSHLQRPAARYERLARFPLGGRRRPGS